MNGNWVKWCKMTDQWKFLYLTDEYDEELEKSWGLHEEGTRDRTDTLQAADAGAQGALDDDKKKPRAKEIGDDPKERAPQPPAKKPRAKAKSKAAAGSRETQQSDSVDKALSDAVKLNADLAKAEQRGRIVINQITSLQSWAWANNDDNKSKLAGAMDDISETKNG